MTADRRPPNAPSGETADAAGASPPAVRRGARVEAGPTDAQTEHAARAALPPSAGVDLLTPRLLAEHRAAVAVLVTRAKRVGGVLALVVMAAYVAAGLALWRLDGSAGVWTALVIATLAFLFFRQLPAVALAFARMPERGRPEQAALQRAIDLALDRQPARDVLRRLDEAAAREPGRRRAQ